MGEVISQTYERARFGVASLKVITGGTTNNEGTFYRINWLSGVDDVLAGSAYVRGSGIIRLRLTDNLSGKTWYSKNTTINDVRWTRLEVIGRCSGGNDVRIYIETNGNSPQAVTFYVDGVQVERKPYVTTYCDGDQDGCQWTVMEHGSISTRSAYTRAGGKWVTLMGTTREWDDLYMTVVGGMGVAPIKNSIQSYADSPGAYYQRQKVDSRVVTLTFHAKNASRLGCAASLEKLHALRLAFYNIIQSDKTAGYEEFLVEYQDGTYPMYIRLRYDGGLEGSWDIRNKWVNSFPVRFVATSPFFTDDNQEVSILSIKETTTVNYAAMRLGGTWLEMNGGLSSYVRQFAIGKRGEIYAVGEFTRANNKTTAIDPQIYANFVAYWDGIQWQRLGSGANGVIYSVAVAPNGDVYVAGNFTSIGGVACNCIAKWNGSAWSALGSGLNSIGYAVKVAPNGDVYTGGNFTTAGGISAPYCAMYDGSWHSLGYEPGLNAAVYTIDISQDGERVYFGGLFTDEYGSPGTLNLDYVALYEPILNSFSELGDGFDNYVSRLFISPSGQLYACGGFTASGAQTILYVAYWNGSSWYEMGIGADSPVDDIFVLPDGTAYIVGSFLTTGSADARKIAYWNGTSWVSIDSSPSGDGKAVLCDRYGNLFFSFNGTLLESAKATLVNNPGSAETPAMFYVVGPGTLKWIENQTSKKRIYFNLEILSGEEILIDCSTGSIQSLVRGNVSYALFPGSDLRAWKLQPGENKIVCLILSDVAAVAQISFIPRFWSADSTSGAE